LLKYIVLIFMCCGMAFFQSVHFDQLGKEKFLRYNGGFTANAVYYDGAANRQGLTYYLTGNLNFNIAGLYNVPLSFTYSNLDFEFPNPFKFNRFSFNLSYNTIGEDKNLTVGPTLAVGKKFFDKKLRLTSQVPITPILTMESNKEVYIILEWGVIMCGCKT
jgi:hypothetical protein